MVPELDVGEESVELSGFGRNAENLSWDLKVQDKPHNGF